MPTVLTAIVLLVGSGVVAFFLRVREPTAPASVSGTLPDPLPNLRRAGGGVSLAAGVADPGMAEVGARWYFNWSYRPHRAVELEFVPLVCGYPGRKPVGDRHLDEVRAAVTERPADYPDSTLFLVGNEIGYRAQHDHRSPDVYARDFHRCHQMLKTLNPTFLVSTGPAILSLDRRITRDQAGAGNGVEYLAKVIDSYQRQYGEPVPADYVAATGHVLHAGPAAMDELQDGIRRLRRLLADAGLRDRGVLLTEFGLPLRGPAPEQIAQFMRNAIPYVATATDAQIGCACDDDRLVQRWAWFTARPLSLPQKLQSTGFGALVLQLGQTSLFRSDGTPGYLAPIYARLMDAAP